MNIRVYEDAERRAMLVNVVDVPPLCNFILPAIIRTGPLAIAISTAGASPALAKRIRNEIAEEYGEPYARLAILLNEVRGWAKGTLPTYQDRKAFFESIVNGEPDPVELLRRGDEAAVRDLIEAAQQTHPACLTSSPISTTPGGARMVDVGGKEATDRRAVARAVVRMSPDTAAAVARGDAPKGDVIGTARIAGIQAAKRTAELIPLCHPLLALVRGRGARGGRGPGGRRRPRRAPPAQTGVEMEAMTAAAVAALTVYDMVKGLERGVEIAGLGAWSRRPAARRTGGAGVRAAVLTVSTSLARGEGEDRLGAGARGAVPRRPGWRWCTRPCPTTARRSRPRSSGSRTRSGVRFVFTTGGTGLTPDDVTPEATLDVIDREAPGYAEAIRADSRGHTPLGILTRGVSGIRGRTLIVNFPGQPEGDRAVVAGGGADARARGGDARAVGPRLPTSRAPSRRSSSSASGVFSSPSSPMPRSTPGVFVNWTSPYSTTCTWLPQGSRKSRPRPPRISAPAAFEAAAGLLHVVHHQPEVALAVGRRLARGRDRQELVAHVDEGHAGHAAAQLEVEHGRRRTRAPRPGRPPRAPRG